MESASRRYLEGFFAGLHARGVTVAGAPTTGRNGTAVATARDVAAAADRAGVGAFDDPWQTLLACAEEDRPPGATGRAALATLGVVDLAPEGRDGCRLRLRGAPGGRLRTWQLRELAAISQESAGGFIEIGERGGPELAVVGWREAAGTLARAAAAGLWTAGNGGASSVLLSPAAGVDPEEVFDVTPLALALGALMVGKANAPRIGLDGGARGWPAAVANDLTLRVAPCTSPSGEIVFRVLLANGRVTLAGGVPATRAATACAALVRTMWSGHDDGDGQRLGLDEASVREALERVLGGSLPNAPELPSRQETVLPPGMFPQRQPSRCALVASGPADGRWRSRALTALAALAALAETTGGVGGEARLWPGGVLVPGVAADRAEECLRALVEITQRVG